MKFDRPTAIRQLLFSKGQMSISDLALALDASEPTVRRDLVALEKDGAVVRTHGGARIADDIGGEVAFETREQIALPQKRAIGEAAHGLLRAHSSIFMDAGTTVLQLARLIRLRPMPLNVFTNCLPVAQVLLHVPEVNVTVLGGQIRVENASMVGTLAEEAIEKLRFDQAFLGIGALGEDEVIYTVDPLEARLNNIALQRAQSVVVLADSKKFGTYLTHRVAAIDPSMTVITDDGLNTVWREKIDACGVTLKIAEPLA